MSKMIKLKIILTYFNCGRQKTLIVIQLVQGYSKIIGRRIIIIWEK